MSNNKQSSLDFYRKNLHSMVSGGSTEFKTEVEIFEQAKAMHKEETVDLIVQYEIKHHLIFTEEGILNTVKKAEQCYNETFGGNNDNP